MKENEKSVGVWIKPDATPDEIAEVEACVASLARILELDDGAS